MKTLTLEDIRSAVQCSTGVSPMFPDVSSSSSSSSLQQQLEQKQQQDTGKMPVLQVTGVNTDSRTVKPGELLVAIKGEKHDAHKFLG